MRNIRVYSRFNSVATDRPRFHLRRRSPDEQGFPRQDRCPLAEQPGNDVSDPTRKPFIERTNLENHMPQISEGYFPHCLKCFLGRLEWVDCYLVLHDMKVVFDRVPGPR